MELVILSGIQCSGKSTFYHHKFSGTHARINLDTIKSRNKEMALYESILEEMRPVVIDNTNPTILDRARYIGPAKSKGYRVIGFQFDIPISIAKVRNSKRQNQATIPAGIIHSTLKKMQPLLVSEGFDEISIVGHTQD